MVACGICQTDAHFRDQHMPIELPAVLGHERYEPGKINEAFAEAARGETTKAVVPFDEQVA